MLQGDVDDRSPLLVSGLGDFGGLLIADDRVQRSDQNRIARQRFLELRLIDLEARDGLVSQQAAGIGQGLIRVAVGLENIEDIKLDLARGLSTLDSMA